MITYRDNKRETESILVKGRGTDLVLKVEFEICTQHYGISSGVRLSRSCFRTRTVLPPAPPPFPSQKMSQCFNTFNFFGSIWDTNLLFFVWSQIFIFLNLSVLFLNQSPENFYNGWVLPWLQRILCRPTHPFLSLIIDFLEQRIRDRSCCSGPSSNCPRLRHERVTQGPSFQATSDKKHPWVLKFPIFSPR